VWFTYAYEDFLRQFVSERHSEDSSSPLGLLANVKDKLLSFETGFSVNVLRSYFETNEDLLTEKDFKIIITNLIHALGSVKETDYQNRLCRWLDDDEFSRIGATFSTKVSEIEMFASTNLERFRAQLTDRMRIVRDAEDNSDKIQRLQNLQAKLNEVTEAGDRRDNT